MKHYLSRISWLLIFMTAFVAKAGRGDLPPTPTCILFKINRSINKIEALKERKRFDDVKLVQQYDEDIAHAIVADFKEHFTFCKVYFFNSLQLHDVIDKHWDKVLFFDQDMTNPVKPDISLFGNVWIVENNFPPPPNYKIGSDPQNPELSKESRSYANANDEFGIVSYNDKYELIEHKICYNRSRLKKAKVPDKYPKEFTYTYIGAEHYNSVLKKYYKP